MIIWVSFKKSQLIFVQFSVIPSRWSTASSHSLCSTPGSRSRPSSSRGKLISNSLVCLSSNLKQFHNSLDSQSLLRQLLNS